MEKSSLIGTDVMIKVNRTGNVKVTTRVQRSKGISGRSVLDLGLWQNM